MRTLTMCTQHKREDEIDITEKCNEDHYGDPKTYTNEEDCAGTWVNGNCYGDCAKGTATTAFLDGSTYAVGTTILTLGGGCGSINGGDKITFAGDPNEYTVAATVETTCPISLSGYPLTLRAPGLVQEMSSAALITILDGGFRDFSSCHKQGWKAVRAQTIWHGREGFGDGCAGCGSCTTPTTHYLKLSKTVEHTHHETGLEYYVQAFRSIEVSSTTGLGVYTCTGIDEGSWGIDAVMAELLAADWSCGPSGFTYTLLGVSLNELLSGACNSVDGTYEISAESGGITTTVAAAITTRTDTLIEFSLTVTNDSDPAYYDTYSTSWALENQYTLAEVVADAYALADTWDLSDDVMHPWRTVDYLRFTDPDTGATYHRSVPFVKRRQAGPLALNVSSSCDPLPDCNGMSFDPCPYDGEIIGAPLPYYTDALSGAVTKLAYNFHYAFYAESTDIAPRGWSDEFGMPTNATWWTKPWDEFGTPTDNAESSMDNYPRGGWVRIEPTGMLVTVQKWVQTRETVQSANLFRPCGADRLTEDQNDPCFCQNSEGCEPTLDCPGPPRRLLWDGRDEEHPLPWAICGRLEILSFSWSGGTTTFTTAASYLQSGDLVDFVYYLGADYTESIEDGPLDAGYEVTVVDSTHFTVSMTEEVYDAMQAVASTYYVKSHGAPHFKWCDNNRKGDFVYCVEETNFCTNGVARTCEDSCTNLVPCKPQVMAILGPDPIELAADHEWVGPPSNVAVRNLPTAPSYNGGVKYVITPYSEQIDPLWQALHAVECDGCTDGEIPACTDPPTDPRCIPNYIERRCSVPEGAPEFVAGGGYAQCSAPVCLEADGDTTGEPTFNRPTDNGQDPPVALSSIGTAVNYDAISFTVDTSGAYQLLAQTNGGWDVFICLYAGGFNPADPLTNCLIADIDYPEDAPIFGQAGIDYNLEPGTTYTAVITGFEDGVYGAYHLSICGVGSVSSV